MKALLAAHESELAVAWASLKTMEKLLFFKLLSPPAALRFFSRLGFDDKYLLLGARDLGAVAPLLEGHPEGEWRLFEPLPDDCYEEMLRLT